MWGQSGTVPSRESIEVVITLQLELQNSRVGNHKNHKDVSHAAADMLRYRLRSPKVAWKRQSENLIALESQLSRQVAACDATSCPLHASRASQTRAPWVVSSTSLGATYASIFAQLVEKA